MARPAYLNPPPDELPSSTGSASGERAAPPPYVAHGQESLSPFAAGRDAPGRPHAPLEPQQPVPGPMRPPVMQPSAPLLRAIAKRPAPIPVAAAPTVAFTPEQSRAEAIKRALTLRALFPNRRR